MLRFHIWQSVSWYCFCRSNMEFEDWRTGKTMSERYLYMFENHVGCDVTFSLGEGHQIEAHKFILISRSAVFEAMFCGSLSERTSTEKIRYVCPFFHILLIYSFNNYCSYRE